MEIIKVEDIYIIKINNKYLAGKYESEDTALFAVDNLKHIDLDTVWNYVLGAEGGEKVIKKEDLMTLLKEEINP
jgi:hypothetical protein